MSHVGRRTFLVGSATIALATACGGSSTTAPAPEFLVVRFPDGYRAASTMIAGVEQRMPFAVADSVDIMRAGAPDNLKFLVTQGNTVIAETAVDAHRAGIITPYYPVKVTFPDPGAYVVSLADYPDILPAEILIVEASDVSLPQPGDSLPAIGTPTLDDSRGVVDICTRAIDCPFHDHNLDDVLANGRPTVLLIATPGFCQTDICGPVVDLLIEAAPGYTGIDFIHAEVYVDPAEFEGGGFPDTSPIVAALGLPYEPILLAANATGEIVTRLDLTWDRAELNEAIATL